MKKYTIFLVSMFMMGSLLTSCNEIDPFYYDGDSNGAYFDYNSREEFTRMVNFGNHILHEGNTLTEEIKIKLLGYLEDRDRRLVLKATAMDEYPMAKIDIPEIIFKKGEFEKKIKVTIHRPEDWDITYGAILKVDSVESEIGIGTDGYGEFTILVEESYKKPENWDNVAKQFFDEFTPEKHIFIAKTTGKEKYFESKNPWGDFPSYQIKVVEAIRAHNQANPDDRIQFKIPFKDAGTMMGIPYPKPYYWGEMHDKYLGQYDSNTFVGICTSNDVSTLNEEEFFTGSEEKLKDLHLQAVYGMMNTLNQRFWWNQPWGNYRSLQIPMSPDIDYFVVQPMAWMQVSFLIEPYYGTYSDEKYKFMIKEWLKHRGDQFFICEMLPVSMGQHTNWMWDWDSSVGGQAMIEECYQVCYSAWEKNKDQYNFTFPKR